MKRKKVDFQESYYLCEGIWIDVEKKILIDEKNNNQILNINKFEDKVLIFEREMYEWLYMPMITLLKDDLDNKSTYLPFKNAIYILFGLFTYIEKLERYRQGIMDTKNPAKIIYSGFRRIFKQHSSSDRAKNILNTTRHSLMHMGIIGDKVLLNYDSQEDIEYIGTNAKLECIKINPHLALKTIAEDFDQYVAMLKSAIDNLELKNHFIKSFDTTYYDEINFINE